MVDVNLDLSEKVIRVFILEEREKAGILHL